METSGDFRQSRGMHKLYQSVSTNKMTEAIVKKTRKRKRPLLNDSERKRRSPSADSDPANMHL